METERLILRDYNEADRDAYFKLKSDNKTMYYLKDIEIKNKYEADKDFDKVLDDIKSGDRQFYFFHIEIKETHKQVDSIGYTVMNNTPFEKLVHLGYFTYPEFWNKGYVTESLKKILEFAFTENNVYRIRTGCLKENKGSERVMQKCSMIKETDKKEYEYHDGRMKDRVEYRILKREWEEQHNI